MLPRSPARLRRDRQEPAQAPGLQVPVLPEQDLPEPEQPEQGRPEPAQPGPEAQPALRRAAAR